MNRYFLLAVVLLAVACAPGCDRPPPKSKATAPVEQPAPGGAAVQELTPVETMAQEAIKLFQRTTDLLKSIRDERSAAAVAPELKAIALQLQDFHRRGLPLGSEIHEKPQVLGRFYGQLDNAIRRYAKEAVRVADQENLLGQEFHDALNEFRKLPQ
jgi:hypothetical protein